MGNLSVSRLNERRVHQVGCRTVVDAARRNFDVGIPARGNLWIERGGLWLARKDLRDE